jgi:hypothetical protein
MATKAGKLHLSDIKQGKQAWLVRVRVRPGQLAEAYSTELVQFRKRPYLSKGNFKFQRDEPPTIAFNPLQNRTLRGWHVTMSAQVYGLCKPKFTGLLKNQRPKYYSRFFTTKKAALRYVERINRYQDLPREVWDEQLPVVKRKPSIDLRDIGMERIGAIVPDISPVDLGALAYEPFTQEPPSADQLKALFTLADELTGGLFSKTFGTPEGAQEALNRTAQALLGLSTEASIVDSQAMMRALKNPAIGPRNHVSDPLDWLAFPSPIRRHEAEKAMSMVLKCECGQERQYPFYLGVVCELCGSKFALPEGEPELAQLDWDELKRKLEAEGGIRPTHLIAEMPLHPPIRLMDGMTNGVEPQRYLSIVRGKRRGPIGNEQFNIRSFGEIDFPMPPEHTGVTIAYQGVKPHATEDEYRYGVNMNLAFMQMPAIEEDPVYDALYREMRKRLPKVTYRLDTQGAPLNLYGDERNYKPFPDLNTLVGEDGILAAVPENWGGKAVILSIDSDPPLDAQGNRAEMIFDTGPHPAMFAYMAGRISQEECEHRIAESKKLVAAMLEGTMEQKPFVDNNPNNEWDPNLDGMALLAVEAGVINEDHYTLVRCRDDSTGFITAFQELSKKAPGDVLRRTTGPTDFMSNFAAENISGNWYVVTRDKRGRCGRMIDQEEYNRRLADNQEPTEE